MAKTDIELVRDYLEMKNMASFEELLSRYIKEIHRFVILQIGFNHPDYSFDIVQDVSIKIWKSLYMYDSKKSSFRTWIYNIARNTCVDFFRSRKIIQNIPIEDTEEVLSEEFGQEDGISSDELVQYIKQIVNTFDGPTKTIFFLKIEQDLTFKEIAEIVKRPMNTVKSVYLRVIDRIKKDIYKK